MMVRCGACELPERFTLRILISLILPTLCLAGVFFLGRFFIRRPEVPTRLVTFGTNPQSKFSLLCFRITGYVFCSVAIAFALLTAVYLAVLTLQTR